MKPTLRVAAFALLLLGSTSCIEYSVELSIDPTDAGTFVIEIEDEGLGPGSLDQLAKTLEAPSVRLTGCSELVKARGRRVRLSGRIDDVRHLPHVPAFRGLRIFFDDIGASATLVQIEHDPLRTNIAGDLSVSLTLPRKPIRSGGGAQVGDATIRVRTPLASLENHELRLWAILPGDAPAHGGRN